MNADTQTVLFNAAPLLTVTAVPLAVVGVALASFLWRDRGRAAKSGPATDREPMGAGLSQQLLDASEPSDVAKVLLDELAAAFDLDLANLALIEDDGLAAVIVAARERGRDHTGIVGKRIALDREASGINTAMREGTAFTVYDAEHSAVVNQRLNAVAKAKSCVYVPVRAGDEVIAVVFGAVRRPRVFDEEELGRMQAFVSEAGLALERSRATIALADALERERLISHVSLELRSRRDVDEVLPAVLEEIGIAVDAARCFIKLGDEHDPAGVAAEWDAVGVPPLGDASRLPVAKLAARLRRTVAVADVLETPALDDGSLGDVRGLSEHGVRAVLATPIVAQERLLGVLAFHRATVGDWSPNEIALAEAVAREAAVAFDTSRLLRESDRRLAEQQALLKAGEALTSDLRFDTVIERLVDELRSLVNADAADCWTLLPGGNELVCRAVLGLPEEEIGRTIPVAGTIGDAIATGKPVLRRDFAETEQPPPIGSYAAFAEVMDAPIFSFGEIRGVLGVCSREPGRFEESDLRLIEAFASLASIALRNAEAYEESAAAGSGRTGLLPDRGRAERAALRAGDARRGCAGRRGGARRRLVRSAPLRRLRPRARGRLRALGRARGAPPRERVGAVPSVRAAARCSHRGGSATTIASATGSERPRRRQAEARSWPSRSSSPAAKVPGSSSSSSRASARSTTHSSSWRRMWRQPRAARSSAAISTSASGAPGIWRSASLGPVAISPASSTRTMSSTSPCGTRCSCSAATAPRRGCSRATRSSCARRRARARSTRSTAALRRRPGSSATSSRRGRRGRSPTSPSIRGWGRPTQCSLPATRATSGCR